MLNKILKKYNLKPQDSDLFNFLDFKGNTVPIFEDKLLYSKYNPQKQAKNIVDKIEQKTILVFGFANIYYIKELLTFKKKVLFVEPKSDIFEAFLKNMDLSFLNDKNIYFLLSDNKTDISDFILTNYNPIADISFTVFDLQSTGSVYKNYQELLGVAKKCIETFKSEYSTQANFCKIWLTNILKNLNYFKKFNKNIIEKYKEKNIQNIHVFAAGASFDENALKKIGKNDIIVAVDTAYQIFLNLNIKPHIVLSIDAQFYTNYHYIGDIKEDVDYVFLLSSCQSSIKHIISKTNRVYFLLMSHPLMQLIFLKSGGVFLKDLGTNVGQAAIFFSSLLNPLNIICYGIDYRNIQGVPYFKYSQKFTDSFQNQSRYNPYSNLIFSYLKDSYYKKPDYHSQRMDFYLENLLYSLGSLGINLQIDSLDIKSKVKTDFFYKKPNFDFSYLKDEKELCKINDKLFLYFLNSLSYFFYKRDNEKSIQEYQNLSKKMYFQMLDRYDIN